MPDFQENYHKTIQEPLEAAQRAEAERQRVAQEQVIEAPTPPPSVNFGYSSNASGPMLSIFMAESGNNPGAINASSGACGLGQALPCSKMPCSLADYGCQVSFFTEYANSRYGGWPQAWMFWQLNHWW